MLPCSLKRQDCLVGPDLANHLKFDELGLGDRSMSSPIQNASADAFWAEPGGSTRLFDGVLPQSLPLVRVRANEPAHPGISSFERIITTHQPVLDSIIAQLPTVAVFNLSHTSNYLRDYLRSYPLAWKTLSFRLPQPSVILGSPGIETPDPRAQQSRQYALDTLLMRVVVPFATRLTSLDLCNTATSGVSLIGCVLQRRQDTLQHLSVRGCKNVSIKYHIVPFLQLHKQQQDMSWSDKKQLALKSLYTYRCRHHRRRPYLPSSLIRRDSDSEPTHDLIELCHLLGIWTDTAWCPTPGPRCLRRKDYHGNRAGAGIQEVWVPFDRLWRSSNRIGPQDGSEHNASRPAPTLGKLWEEMESGHDGEALGTKNGPFVGEGRDMPAHLRKSHRTFVEDIKCDECNEVILERCETCSIKMHCMGCRKTLCSSCAFNRPVRKRRPARPVWQDPMFSQSVPAKPKKRKDKFWWAPGHSRSPNIMTELTEDSDSDSDATVNHVLPPHGHQPPLKINMTWCCLEPIFSGGGGVAFLGPGLGGPGSDRIRAVPLPKRKEYEDPDFSNNSPVNPYALSESKKNIHMFEEIMGSNIDILPYLQQFSLELQAENCPRSLCSDCYKSFRWKVSCRACKRPLCKEHDFRALKLRKCGFRDLTTEREYVRNPPKQAREELTRETSWPRSLQIPAFRPAMNDSIDDNKDEERRARSDNQEWSDTASSAEEAGTREPSSTPSAAPGPSQDRASSFVDDNDLGNSLADLDLNDPSVNLPWLPRPGPRPRSVSLSELKVATSPTSSETKVKTRFGHYLTVGNQPSQQPIQKERLLLPCNGSHPVQWQGCGAYFCQSTRPVGDGRGRCYASGKECGECGVFVCEFCLATECAPPTCTCKFCDENFHCSICIVKPSVTDQCLREAQIREKELEKEAEARRLIQEREDRESADEVIAWGGEFWGGLVDGYVDEHDLMELAGLDELMESTELVEQNEDDGLVPAAA